VRWIVSLFVVIPLLELYLLIQIGAWLGLGATVLLTLVTGLLGGMLARSEGLRVWHSWQRSLAEMRPPEHGVVEGLLVLVGGVLLITPGVLTDVVGLLCVVPASRHRIAVQIRKRLEGRWQVGLGTGSMRGPASWSGEVIETTGQSVTEDASRPGAER
jgi:UPF0716 protein FxsA